MTDIYKSAWEKAEKRIAELEAELARETDDWSSAEVWYKQAIAELEAGRDHARKESLKLANEHHRVLQQRDELQRRIDSHPDPDPKAGNFFSINGYAVECRNWYYKDGPGRGEQ